MKYTIFIFHFGIIFSVFSSDYYVKTREKYPLWHHIVGFDITLIKDYSSPEEFSIINKILKSDDKTKKAGNISHLTELAKQGSHPCQVLLHRYYALKDEMRLSEKKLMYISKKKIEAKKWLEEAFEQNYLPAIFEIGKIHIYMGNHFEGLQLINDAAQNFCLGETPYYYYSAAMFLSSYYKYHYPNSDLANAWQIWENSRKHIENIKFKAID